MAGKDTKTFVSWLMNKTKECQSSHTNLANKIEISQCALIHGAYENITLERLY